MPSVTTVLVTGASAGLGKECCRQLAELDGIRKIVMGCRNAAKAETAKANLERVTGKGDGFFEILIMDVTSLKSVREAVENLKDAVDALVLNAGGPGQGDPLATNADGVTNIMALNVLGHALLVDLLIEGEKLAKSGSVVFSGSEAARGVPNMGAPRPELNDGSTEEFVSICDGSYVGGDKELYAATKLLGALWIGHMARCYPNFRFLTMSPGATGGTEILSSQPFWLQMIFRAAFQVMQIFGAAHSVEIGAKRYVDALCNGESFTTGAFYASRDGLTGPVVDQSNVYDVFANRVYQENANSAIHKFLE